MTKNKKPTKLAFFGDLKEFDPLKHLPTSYPRETPPPPLPVDTDIPFPQNIKIAISLDNDDDDDIAPAHPTILPIPNQTNEWEDIDSSGLLMHLTILLPQRPQRLPSLSRTDMFTYTLQGLDVVHEEEEDCIIKGEEDPQAGSDLLKKCQSYPYIQYP